MDFNKSENTSFNLKVSPWIDFKYQGIAYTVSSEVFNQDKKIVLPDGRVLEVLSWGGVTNPRRPFKPEPVEIKFIPHRYYKATPQQIARKVGGVLAKIKS